MRIDHGHVQPYAAMDPSLATPIVPVMINANGAPRPSLRRCAEFGRAVGEVIRASPGYLRVALIASGGLSHWLPPMSADDAGISNDQRDYVINGRARVVEYNAARERSSIERRRAKIAGRVNEDWDRWFLSTIASHDLAPLLDLSDQELEHAAGNGAHELRSWIAAAAAWDKVIERTDYEPVPYWVTGMGVMSAFAA
jgi:2,3-dihydroxyphenylpropionate 1,2-dioxygenase